MNAIELRRKASELKAQRSVYQQKLTPPAPVAPQVLNVSVLGGLIKYDIELPQAPVSTDSSLALSIDESLTELQSYIAGQSAELAQLRQAVIVLAQSAKNVETGIQPLADGINQVIENTKIKIRPFSDIKTEMTKAWRDILDDAAFLNDGQIVVTAGRVLRNVFSFGSGVPEAVRTAKREVYTHVKLVRSLRDKIEKLYEYALINHADELSEWINFPHNKLTADKKSWTITQTFDPSFIDSYMRTLCQMRALPTK